MTLPTKEDVVSRLLHLHYKNDLTVKKCVENVVAELIEVWTKLSIVTRDKARIKECVEKLYNKYYMLTKNKDRRSAPKIKREDDLQLEFKKLFDIAHKDCLQKMTNDYAKEFLLCHRNDINNSNRLNYLARKIIFQSTIDAAQPHSEVKKRSRSGFKDFVPTTNLLPRRMKTTLKEESFPFDTDSSIEIQSSSASEFEENTFLLH